LGIPVLGPSLRILPLHLWKIKIAFKTRGSKLRYIDIHKLHWVSPNDIRFLYFKGSHDHTNDHGTIVGGDWDLSILDFERLPIYKALKERFVKGLEWENVKYIQTQLGYLRAGKDRNSVEDSWKYWGIKTESELWKKCRKYDDLYVSMKKKGYMSQKEIQKETDPKEAEIDEITVRIGRYGDLLFQDGRHRLVLTKIVGVPKVAIKITARHKKWVTFRNEIIQFSEENKGKVYQPLLHIDLEDIPSTHNNDRFEIIQQKMDRKPGSLLDIGANFGYFCHRFEKLGFDCVAVEQDDRSVYFLKRLKRASNRSFKIFHGSIFDYCQRDQFDVVIALNIFHHFMKTQQGSEKLCDFLGRLHIGTMFFEPHDPSEKPMQSAFLNLPPNAFSQWILEHSNLRHAELIGQAYDGRKIYKLTS
jgi:SAM-dependent methyltransferase